MVVFYIWSVFLVGLLTSVGLKNKLFFKPTAVTLFSTVSHSVRLNVLFSNHLVLLSLFLFGNIEWANLLEIKKYIFLQILKRHFNNVCEQCLQTIWPNNVDILLQGSYSSLLSFWPSPHDKTTCNWLKIGYCIACIHLSSSAYPFYTNTVWVDRVEFVS